MSDRERRTDPTTASPAGEDGGSAAGGNGAADRPAPAGDAGRSAAADERGGTSPGNGNGNGHEQLPRDLASLYGAGPAPGPAAPQGRRARREQRRTLKQAQAARGRGRGGLVGLEGGADPTAPGPKPKLKWFRLLALLTGLGLLAAVSTVFGMMMAVASDLPEIDVLDVPTRQSVILDRNGRQLGVLTGNEQRLLVQSSQIAPVMKHAIVSIEDRRFYTNSGVDLRGIGRALWQDVVARQAVQGGSTIAQQLVKNRLDAQTDRTIFQKLREAAMAFHMTRKWDKERILRNYLNTIYFGNGAYGVEAAARTYFGSDFGLDTPNPQCGSNQGQRRCASLLEPAQAALIAAVVANPSAYDPVAHPRAARARRDLVLHRMTELEFLTQAQLESALDEPIPTRNEVQPPQVTTKYPYFTTWVRQQVVDQVGAGKAFEGGLKVETTIDSQLQDAAQAAVTQWLGPNAGSAGQPAAALVALDNRTSEVLAMVGGSPDGYNKRPFNLATQGQRQPGSSFKPFILAEALEDGYGPTSTFSSRKKAFCVTQRKGRCIEQFVVNNYDDAYSGVTTLANATAFSDNSVFAELGLKVGTKKVARLARRMGVRTPVSSNFAMTLGGLSQGVTVLDMAHAYESFASGGNLVYGSLSPGAEAYKDKHHKGTAPGPVGIQSIKEPVSQTSSEFRTAETLDGSKASNHKRIRKVLPKGTAGSVESILQGVVRIGSGKRASIGADVMVAGKTGTTENYGDAWFVGWSPRYTVAVWVGYPDEVKSMEPPTFSFNGEPVAGGTYPAAIWGTFMRQAMQVYARRHPDKTDELKPETSATPAPVLPPASGGDGGTGGAVSTPAPSLPETPATTEPSTPAVPEDTTPAEPAPEPSAPAGDGGTGAAPEGGEPAPAPDTGTGTGTGAGTGTDAGAVPDG